MIVQAPGVAKTSAGPVRPKTAEEKAVMPTMPVTAARRAAGAKLALNAPKRRQQAARLAAALAAQPNAAAGVQQNTAASRAANAADTSETIPAKPVAGSRNPPPDYPAAARAHGEQGKVLLSIHVLPDGQANAVQIERSSGFKLLDQAAVNAVLKWRFQPAYQSGQAAASVLPYWIDFKLVN